MRGCLSYWLFFNTSKIQFESKSQPFYFCFKLLSSCFSIRQRYNLKANHNSGKIFWLEWKVVFQYVKDTIWKQITTIRPLLLSAAWLFFNTSKIQFESKSQLERDFKIKVVSCFSIRQRYNLKANHNRNAMRNRIHIVVFQYVKDTIWKQITTYGLRHYARLWLFFNTSKIQFESKSQQSP